MGDKLMHWGLGRLYLVDIQEEASWKNWLELWGQVWAEMGVRTSGW